nr:unnamed protein product [Digitaria exilis]
MGRLLLGEASGLRVFPLRGLMKGGKEKEGKKEGAGFAGRKSLQKKNGMVNGLVVPVRRGSHGERGEADAVSSSHNFEGKTEFRKLLPFLFDISK